MTVGELTELAGRLKTVFVFCGDICPVKEGEDYPSFEGWRSTRGLEADKTGPVFSYERVLAAAELWKMNNELTVVPSGGVTNVGYGKSPPISSVVRFELEALGVEPESIVEEDQAFNTQQQVIICDRLERWANCPKRKAAILAPCWQLSRILAMITYLGDSLKLFQAGLTHLIPIEMVLSAVDNSWRARFLEWYANHAAREMFAMEALGAGQVCGGFQPQYPYPYPDFPHPLLRGATPM